jgi:hypothetical protein
MVRWEKRPSEKAKKPIWQRSWQQFAKLALPGSTMMPGSRAERGAGPFQRTGDATAHDCGAIR